MGKLHRSDIDLLKGLSIVAVVLYHMGILPFGYFGVDVFLVINGFLIILSVYKKMESGQFNYFEFLKSRFIRLAPLVVIACIVSMLVGFFGMLPDDYENLAESSVASLFFSNNILSSYISADYWNVVNEYKPLMHLWYVGVLAEFYIIIPFIVWIDIKLAKRLNAKHGGGYYV